MKGIIVIILCTFLGGVASCNHPVKLPTTSKDHKDTVDKIVEVAYSDDFVTKVKLTDEDSVINEISSSKAFIYLAYKYYNIITDTSLIDYLNVEETQSVSIKDYGSTTISEISIKGKYLSNVVPKKCYLLYNKGKNEVFFFNFSRLYLIKKKASDTAYLIGGIPIIKGVGYFLVYSFNNASFTKVFDSGMDIEDDAIAVPIYLNEGDCIQYSGNFLRFENLDINNDGFLDFSFEGTVKHYCNPNEYGIDISKRKPLRQEQVKINYIFEGSEKLSKWVLIDSSKVKHYLE
jgi:hypothetical protein